MTTLPTDKAEDTAIDAEKIRDRDYDGWDDALELSEAILKASGSSLRHYEAYSKDRIGTAAYGAIQAAKAEADHFKSHFTKLAKVNAAANAALDTARREWAKRGEG